MKELTSEELSAIIAAFYADKEPNNARMDSKSFIAGWRAATRFLCEQHRIVEAA